MKKFKIIICLGIVFIFSQALNAQYLLSLSDKNCVGLSLDMLKKGVQQEDTTKVMRVLGTKVLVQGVEINAKNLISQNISQIFINSSKR